MYLLDTNVVSVLDPRRRVREPDFVDWIERNGVGLFLSAMTVVEMEAGVLKLRREDKKERAEELARLLDGVLADFAERVLPMDAEVALNVARMAETARPNVIGLADMIIAATAQTHGLTVLTRNLRHFGPTGIAAADPFVRLPPDVAR